MITKPTYESITSGLRKMVEQLKAHTAAKTAEASSKRRAAEVMHNAADMAEAEASKATHTANKIAELLG